MRGILRPDLKAVVWAGIGFLVVPMLFRTVSGLKRS